MTQTHLVIGATGAQGGAVAARLARDGHTVRGFSRKHGDLADPVAVRKAFEGVSRASVTLPLVFDAGLVARYVDNIIAAARHCERLVLNTGNRLPSARTSVAAFETRRDAADALLGSEIPTVVLRPPVYLENLRPADGVLAYPIPPGHRVAWLSQADLGALTAAALHRADLAGTSIDIGGRDVVTGPELASVFGADYVPLPPDEFEAWMAPVLGGAAAAAVADTYRWLSSPENAGFYDGDPTAVEALLGVELTPIRRWAAG
ncbi:NAD-dependent epimerase/dehydratase family protein [Actinomadura sp. 6K520]|uniref:SDR family oxidoreductase n=1 Tax=Actinomadura sp. 6K520 TaxID=2530364 RepID=UPI00104EF0C2|nr:NAD-dependent epimerase/dehydratase family protein [Actinomadura sp. 6K520]TDE19587.1 NAD-dependent epimerase/dehydratase family protein [Actinomadura sp. 6K520]